MGEESNTFLDLLDMMRSYEESAATLTAKQRDHYVHSVNVFLLGLAVYSQNKKYRTAFAGTVLDRAKYPDSYTTDHEEFFYRWGISALFHDVGYPVEIINKQTNQYLNFVLSAVYDERGILKANEIRTYIEYEDFSKFNILPDAGGFTAFCHSFLEKEPRLNLENVARPIDLLAYSIADSFDIDFLAVKFKLDGFVKDMQKFGFVDHGFYSAVIVLQWYAFLMQSSGWNASYFYVPIVNCATAILLHNYYGNVLQKKPFELPPMRAEQQPLGWLLILCDELQEWNREAYGFIDKTRIAADRSDITITEDSFKTIYVSAEGLLGDNFERDKEELLYSRLDLAALFKDGFEVDSVNEKSTSWRLYEAYGEVPHVARPLLSQLEEIAKQIHADYVESQRNDPKSEDPELRGWDELPEDLKYSNLAQARHIVEKLRLIGCGVAAKGADVTPLTELSKDEVEYLAVVEHDRWMHERFSSGWTWGKRKNSTKKLSPYLVPWDALSQKAKNLDREPVRNIIPLLEGVGLVAYRITPQ